MASSDDDRSELYTIICSKPKFSCVNGVAGARGVLRSSVMGETMEKFCCSNQSNYLYIIIM